jgi:hypothetical protein
MLGLACAISSCLWQEADAIVAMADSIDQNHHVIYDDTVALRKAIHTLNNPLGRTFQRSTLGKAFYYMGRNLEDDYSQVARAAECYVAADWLKIDDPIYRGRVNSCMAGICGNYGKDSLSLLFYERALEHFALCNDTIYYARGLLNIGTRMDALHRLEEADSILRMAAQYDLTDTYCYSVNDAFANHYYRLQSPHSPDSIIYYLRKNPITNSWRASFLAGAFYDLGQMDSAAYYATKIVYDFNIPAHKVSAYYILHKYAILNNDILAADSIAGLRMDEKRNAEFEKIDSIDGIQIFEEYLAYCAVYRRRVLLYCLAGLLALSVVVALLWYWQRAKKEVHAQTEAVQLAQEAHQQTLEEQRNQRLEALMQHVEHFRARYPKPNKEWSNYEKMRTELNQSLLCLLDKLAERKLSEKEIRLCVFCLLYHDVSTKVLAEYMIYSAVGIRTFKQRTAQKLGTTAANLYDFLVELAISN